AWSLRAWSSSGVASAPRGGTSSTEVTNSPRASLAPSRERPPSGIAASSRSWSSGCRVGSALTLATRAGSWLARTNRAIAATCSGVVPQQPPTNLAPDSTIRRAYSPTYSGDATYSLRPPTSRGRPALGWATIGTVTTRANRSTASSTTDGPVEQFTPTASAPAATSAGP